MNIQAGDDQLVEAYLNGTLAEAELSEFEARLAAEPELAAYLSMSRELRASLGDQEKEQFMAQLREVMQKQQKAPISLRRSMIISLSLAAALITLLLFIWPSPPQPSQQALLADNLQAYPMLLSSREAGQEQVVKQNAIQAYEKADYAKAAALFTQWSVQDSTPHLASLYAGLSWVLAGQYTSGISTLEALEQDAPETILPAGRWYLALAYLGNKQTEKALEKLNQLRGTTYEEKAQVLSDNINSSIKP